jgi:hypothetical protein
MPVAACCRHSSAKCWSRSSAGGRLRGCRSRRSVSIDRDDAIVPQLYMSGVTLVKRIELVDELSVCGCSSQQFVIEADVMVML